ncbi:glycosyltransferase [Polynucleobacter sp. AP-Elch-400A-B2]|uniref:glycosyltransferase family 2 protein n=1 Tax=Polynucleobacter sp. AP-Elch-400A-B2 TaxID=2576930 RepID=UPI001BFE1B6E|nr:glycosyltransferase family 2 protein [Polynucleobacter sp. AP-Elch-400A-B2]QWE24970.1 glycosyltransferase [Polynucleobacter sp. AP-Elch-400A-B2]
MKKITVITVSFNSERTIEKTLRSVNGQTYQNIEHIVIDGCSLDKTLELVSKYKDRPGVVLAEPDYGIYDAMNKGLDRSQGDVICFLNSDDEFFSPFIVEQVMLSFQDNQLNVVYGDVLYQSADGSPVRYYSSQRFSDEKLKYGLMPAHPSLFIKAGIYKQIGGYDASYRIAGDFEMCCRLFQVSGIKAKYLEMPFVKMLTGGASAIRLSNVILVNKEIRRACVQSGIDTSYFKLLLRYMIKLPQFFLKFSK